MERRVLAGLNKGESEYESNPDVACGKERLVELAGIEPATS
jgi:hypothetical protein